MKLIRCVKVFGNKVTFKDLKFIILVTNDKSFTIKYKTNIKDIDVSKFTIVEGNIDVVHEFMSMYSSMDEIIKSNLFTIYVIYKRNIEDLSKFDVAKLNFNITESYGKQKFVICKMSDPDSILEIEFRVNTIKLIANLAKNNVLRQIITKLILSCFKTLNNEVIEDIINDDEIELISDRSMENRDAEFIVFINEVKEILPNFEVKKFGVCVKQIIE